MSFRKAQCIHPKPLSKEASVVAAGGFTLIELIAVMVIAGILSSIGLVNLSRRLEGERLKEVSKTTATWLEDRRKQAMTAMEQAGIGVCEITIDAANATLSANSTTVSLPSPQSGTLKNICYNPDPLELRSLSSNSSALQLSAAPDTITQLRFSFRGTSSNNGGCTTDQCPPDAELKIKLNDQAPARCLRITNPLGQIRLGVARPADQACTYLSTY